MGRRSGTHFQTPIARSKNKNQTHLKTMELGKNATDELYSSSKQPFLQANIKIHFFLVYWDTRNSLLYNLITSFIDGVTLKPAQYRQGAKKVKKKHPGRVAQTKFEPVATTTLVGNSNDPPQKYCILDVIKRLINQSRLVKTGRNWSKLVETG